MNEWPVCTEKQPHSTQLLVLSKKKPNSQEAKTPAQHFGKWNSVYWQEWKLLWSELYEETWEEQYSEAVKECPQSAEVELITHGQLLFCRFNSKCLIKIQQKAASQVSKDRHLALNPQSTARQQKETLLFLIIHIVLRYKAGTGKKRFYIWAQFE